MSEHSLRRWIGIVTEATIDGMPRPGTGLGWQPLDRLISAARSAMDDMDDEEYERFERLSGWRKVAYRYLSADCDNFAIGLHRITGWPIVGNTAHRLVQGPRGLIDASGWVTVEQLRRRYREWWHDLGPPGGESVAHSHMIGDTYDGFDDILAEVVSAIRQFPWAPFNTKEFRQLSFRPIIGVDERVPDNT